MACKADCLQINKMMLALTDVSAGIFLHLLCSVG